MPPSASIRSVVIASCSLLTKGIPAGAAAGASSRRFATQGPVLSITLKDPFRTSDSLLASSSPSRLAAERDDGGPLASLSRLNPTLLWSVRSTVSPPWNDTLPSLKSCAAAVGYRYDDLRTAPSFFDVDAHFETRLGRVDCNPSYEVKSRKANIDVRVTGDVGRWYGAAKLSSKARWVLESIRASYKMPLSSKAMKSLTLEPSLDVTEVEPNVVLSGESSSGRTMAVLRWNPKDPTLTVIHKLDER